MRNDEKKFADFKKAWGKIVVKAWVDESYKQRVLKNPEAVLKENGVELPQGMKLKAVEDTSEVHHVIIRQKPTDTLSVEELKKISGGYPEEGACSCTCRYDN